MPSDPRVIPSIERLRQRPRVSDLEARYGRGATLGALREEAASLRVSLAASGIEVRGVEEAAQRIEAAAAARLGAALAPSLTAVINATGVHRSPPTSAARRSPRLPSRGSARWRAATANLSTTLRRDAEAPAPRTLPPS